MSRGVLKGLCWAHRRAQAPMVAAGTAFQARHGLSIDWDVQPLAAFEHALGHDLANRYDLIVFDHPFCGAIAREGLLRPLDGLGLRDDSFIGASLASYTYECHLWGLPIDGATQTALYRPDLLDSPPANWDETVALGARERRMGRSLGMAACAPHAFLVLLALCANLGAPLSDDPSADQPFDRAVLQEAMDRLATLWVLCDQRGLGWNAIDLHDAMSGGGETRWGECVDNIAYAPLAFAYLTYAEADMAHPLHFADFAGPGPDPAAGTVLGGAGLGVTHGCRDVEAAAAFLKLLADGTGQTAFVANHHGQPAARSAWDDAASDAPYGGARRATRVTMERAWVRPRFSGYIPFQDACGHVMVRWLAGDITQDALTAEIDRLWRSHGQS